MTVWADDRGRVWAAIGAGHGGMRFLTLDNVGYVVDLDDRGSVGRQEDLFPLIVGRSGIASRAMLERLARQRAEIVPAGTETIAGVTGDVYRVTLIEGETRAPPFDIVVAAAPRLAPVGRELLRFYDSLGAPILAAIGSVPQPYVAIRALLARGTPLRFAGMRLQSIENRPFTDEMAALPGPVLGRDAFTALAAGLMGPEDSTAYVPDEGNLVADGNGSFEAVESANDAFPE